MDENIENIKNIENQKLGETDNNIGILGLIYGVIFEPVKTFKVIGEKPPIINVVIIFSIIQALSMFLFIIGGISSDSYMSGGFPGIAEFVKSVLYGIAFGGFVFAFVKWFLYSCVLFFLSELMGGSGKALGVLTATGLASIPSMLMSPVQLLLILLGDHWWTYLIAGLLMIFAIIWFIALLVIGLRETQQINSSKALAVVFIPVGVVMVLAILFLVITVSVVAPILMRFQEFGGGI